MNLQALRFKISPSKHLPLLLLLGTGGHLAIGQQALTQLNAPTQIKPVSLPHLYWHFLIHQSELDAFAVKLAAEGQNGQALRNDMQNQLQFSDADYAPIRTASQQLASELRPIEARLSALQGPNWNPAEVQALIALRDADINSEITSLSTELSPQNKITLENFMARFFAPKPVTTASTSTGNRNQQGARQ